jgi:hypothetical protein
VKGEAVLAGVIAIACSFVLGYSAQRASTCAVRAAAEVYERRFPTLLIGFVIAAAAAGLICVACSKTSFVPLHFAGRGRLGSELIAGAVLVGCGAVINGGCLLGTLAGIGRGEVRLLAVLPGLALGFWVAQVALGRAATMAPPPLALPPPPALALAIFLPLFATGWLVLEWHGQSAERRISVGLWMTLMGCCGALLFAIQPGWSYADAIRRGVALPRMTVMAPMSIGWTGVAVVVTMFAGAISAGLAARSFRLVRPSRRTISASFLGGSAMAVGATLVPGGNDTLLFWAIPALSASGIAAYAVMTLTIFALIGLTRLRATSR